MEKIKKIFTKNLEDLVSLDLRALGFFRIFLGSIFLIDILDRLKDVSIFYSSAGVGVNDSTSILGHGTFSINFLNGNSNFQYWVLIVAAILSVALIIGFKTRISTILLWIFVLSIQNRNFVILQGGDDYMRILLFWGMFLPLGKRLSYDYFKNKSKYDKLDNKFVSPINIGLIFQVIFLYYFSALSKSSPIWNKDFTAIYYSLSLDGFVTWLGRILLTLKPLLKPLTAFVYYLELYVGGLLVLPVWSWIARTIAILLIIMLHLGIGTTLDVGPFPWIAICGALSLLPTNAIDFAIQKIKTFTFYKKINSNSLKKKLKPLLPEEKVYGKPILSKKLRNYIFTVGTILISIFTFSVTFVSYVWNSNNNGLNMTIPEPVKSAFVFIRMDQIWSMFAPYPFTDDGWYVMLGHKSDGTTESLFGTTTKTDFNDFPPNYSQDFKNERWRKFTNNLYYDRYQSLRKDWLYYVCKEWNSDPSKTVNLQSVELHYMLQRTLPDFQTEPIQNLNFGEVSCSI